MRSLDEFFKGIQSEPVKLAVVGCGCSVATEPVAEISHHWNISQVYMYRHIIKIIALCGGVYCILHVIVLYDYMQWNTVSDW